MTQTYYLPVIGSTGNHELRSMVDTQQKWMQVDIHNIFPISGLVERVEFYAGSIDNTAWTTRRRDIIVSLSPLLLYFDT